MNGPYLNPWLTNPRLQTLTPQARSAVSVKLSADGQWLIFLLCWLCTAPTLSGTPYKHWYAFGLAAFSALWCMSHIGSTNALGRVLLKPENWVLMLALLGTGVSTALSPYPTRSGDLFQLARECYLVFMFAFLCVLTQSIDERQLETLIYRFVVVFLCSAIVLCILQNYSSFVFDALLQYYHIEASAEAEGYMRARPGLTFGNPNGAGMAISFVSILGLTRSRSSMPTAAFILVGGIAGILWTSSRTALFAHSATLLLIFMTYNMRMVSALIVFGIAAFFLGPLIVSDQTMDWVNQTWNRFANERTSYIERQDIWERLLVNSDWRNSPIFGLGPSTERLDVADSGYVLSLYRYGYVGLIGYVLWPLILCWKGCWNYIERQRSDLAIRLVSITACFLISSYAMAPMTDPRLCTLYLFIVSTALRFNGEQRQVDSIVPARSMASRITTEHNSLNLTKRR